MKLVPRGLDNFISTFLKGVWYGMGPDLTKKTIKSPKRKGTIPRSEIRKVVSKYPPRRKNV